MKLLIAALGICGSLAGCSAAQSALGSVLTPKPTAQVTVVTNVPAVAIAAPTPDAHHGRVAAAVSGGVAGAVVGGVAGAVLSSGAPTIAGAALVGAGVGTVIALAVHDIAD
jgi:outer membrane lipoprotein SlyB